MVADPRETPVTTPPELTTATAGLLEPQTTARPERMLPPESRRVAVASVVSPATMLLDARVAVTEATAAEGGAVTVTVADPLFPSVLAVIAVVPTPTAVTVPLESTVATEPLADDQVTDRPVRTLPLESRRMAEAVVV